MVTLFVVTLMVKIPSPFMLSTRAATAWIRTGRKQGATVLEDRGVLRLRLQRFRLQATPQVVVLLPLVLKRSSTSSLRSKEPARRPCRTRGGGFILYRLCRWCLLL